jgi:hypothetical protein
MSFLIRFEGGPMGGTTATTSQPWPLPERLTVEAVLSNPPAGLWRGEYVKISESQLAEDFPGVMRGAQYRWEPSGG